MDALIRSLTPETTARLAAAISNVLRPGMDDTDFVIVNKLSTKVYEVGADKAGIDFITMYFDAVADDPRHYSHK